MAHARLIFVRELGLKPDIEAIHVIPVTTLKHLRVGSPTCLSPMPCSTDTYTVPCNARSCAMDAPRTQATKSPGQSNGCEISRVFVVLVVSTFRQVEEAVRIRHRTFGFLFAVVAQCEGF